VATARCAAERGIGLVRRLRARIDRVGRVHVEHVDLLPAFWLARLRVRRDGKVSYRVKKASRGRVTERVMSSVETLARLAAIVPPPRYPLLRFHGLLAPRHRWRDRVVPRPPPRAHACKGKPQELASEETTGAATPRPPPRPAREAGDGRAAFALDVPLLATASLTTSGLAEHLAPHVLSLSHWERILEGELYAS
jgi:Putative transposase